MWRGLFSRVFTMENSNVSPVSHLIVNRIEVTSDRCNACGKDFASNATAGARALSAALAPEDRTYVFCAACGDSIMGHVQTDAVRQRYVWDWIVPLRGTIGEST